MAVFNARAAGGGAGDVYSTEETRIGTWIDGKPLYRRVYQITTPAEDTGDSYKTYDKIPSYCENVRGYGFMKDRWSMYMPIPQYWDTGMFVSLGIIPGAWFAIRCKGENNLNRPATIILEYTKTTD